MVYSSNHPHNVINHLLCPPTPPPGSKWNLKTQNRQVVYYTLDFNPQSDPIITRTLTFQDDGTHVVRFYGRRVKGDMFELLSINNITILDLLSKLSSLRLCTGHTDPKYRLVAASWDSDKHNKHVHYQRIHVKGTVTSMTMRSEKCLGYVAQGTGQLCQHCVEFGNTLRPAYLRMKAYQRRSGERSETGSTVPISTLNLQEAQDRAKKSSKEKKRLQQQVRRLKQKIRSRIQEEGDLLSKEQSAELLETMKENNNSIMATYPKDSFENLFWQEQMKASMVKSKSG